MPCDLSKIRHLVLDLGNVEMVNGSGIGLLLFRPFRHASQFDILLEKLGQCLVGMLLVDGRKAADLF